MRAFDRATAFLGQINAAKNQEELAEALSFITRELGFAHFAISHHVDIQKAPETAIRLHNYPDDWVEYYDSRKLGVSDPVHRASHHTSVGFTWSQMPGLIRLTAQDQDVLERAVAQGIGDGFTIPAHVPGESHGSCSFANPKDAATPGDQLPFAQLVGSFAFEAARRLWRVRETIGSQMPRLTERQRECVMWMARGKSDWEISLILGIRHETVVRHLKQARERYGVSKRAMLAVQVLFDGELSFSDILRR